MVSLKTCTMSEKGSFDIRSNYMMEVPQILLVGKRGTSNVNKVQVGFQLEWTQKWSS